MTLMPPVAAAAQAVVPPDNPAAIQYTQAYPTSHGPADAHRKHKRSPEQALGGHNAERLEAQGKAGQEAARVAAETAPETAGGQATGKGSGPGSTGHPKNQGRNAGGHRASQQAAAGADSGGGSGLGNVAGQATGLGSSDATGLLLPLVLLGAVAWAVAYVLRRRRRAEQ